MNQAEYLGAQLVMEIRRQSDALAAWQASTDKINDLYDQIIAMSGSETYASTGDIPRVRTPQEMPTETLTVAEGLRALRPDRTDGGSTYRLTPISDSTAHMPAILPCLQGCPELHRHVHRIDGSVQPTG
jgi:hypothetical protein